MREQVLKANVLFPGVAALLAAIALFTSASAGVAQASDPIVTSDVVLVMEDSYGLGETATLALRNDGDIPYVYHQYIQGCALTYQDASGRAFYIPPAVHCDLPQETELAPGQTVTILSGWKLDECTVPAFFCMAVRPLASGDYTISGSLRSADGTKRAHFSKTIFITGPRFTTDISIQFGVVVSDPPTGEFPVFADVINGGAVPYTVPEPCRFLLFFRPDGHLFTPPSVPCDGGDRPLGPGGSLRVLSDWNRDECVEFTQTGCVTAPLPPGDYTVKGGLWSQDRQAYAEFSRVYTIGAQTQPSTPFPTPSPAPPAPVVLPKGGGAPLGPVDDRANVSEPSDDSRRAGIQMHVTEPNIQEDGLEPADQKDGGLSPFILAAFGVGVLALAGGALAVRTRRSLAE